MLNRRVLGSFVMSAALLAGPVVHAETFAGVHTPVIQKSVKAKMVSFSLRNDTKEPMTLKAGETTITLVPGKVTDVKLAVGNTLVAQNASTNYAVGDVIATVSTALSSATVSLK